MVLHRVEPRDASHEHRVLADSELGAEPRARRGVRPEALEVDSVLEDAGPGRRDSEGRNLREKRREERVDAIGAAGDEALDESAPPRDAFELQLRPPVEAVDVPCARRARRESPLDERGPVPRVDDVRSERPDGGRRADDRRGVAPSPLPDDDHRDARREPPGEGAGPLEADDGVVDLVAAGACDDVDHSVLESPRLERRDHVDDPLPGHGWNRYERRAGRSVGGAQGRARLFIQESE